MPQPTEADPQAWRRWLAMQANNRGWDLSVQERTAAEDREMLDAAHASAWLWAPIGTELNRMRSTMLLAEVTALVGDTSRALVLASEMRAYFLSHETPDWEIALTHVITAHCAARAGERELHREAFESSIAAIAKIAEAEDRAIVEKTFAHVPVP
jgi:hypothetical protein